MTPRSGLALLSLALLVSFAACRTPLPGTPLPADDPRPARLLAALEAESDARHSLRGAVQADFTGPDLRLARPQRIALSKPASMRIEILGLFDQIAALLVTDGHTYQFYDPAEGELQEGVVTPGLLWDLARLDLQPREAVDYIMGALRPGPGLVPGGARAFADGRIEVDLREPGGPVVERFTFDDAGQLRAYRALAPDGDPRVEIDYDDYAPLDAGERDELFAHTVEIRFPRVESRVSIRFKSVMLGDALPASLFELRLPRRRTGGS